MTVTKFF